MDGVSSTDLFSVEIRQPTKMDEEFVSAERLVKPQMMHHLGGHTVDKPVKPVKRWLSARPAYQTLAQRKATFRPRSRVSCGVGTSERCRHTWVMDQVSGKQVWMKDGTYPGMLAQSLDSLGQAFNDGMEKGHQPSACRNQANEGRTPNIAVLFADQRLKHHPSKHGTPTQRCHGSMRNTVADGGPALNQHWSVLGTKMSQHG